MAIAYISHRDCLLHDTADGHPECARRITVIEDRFIATGLSDILRHFDAPSATESQLLRVHTRGHLAALESLAPETGYVRVDPDTIICADSLTAARRAAGAVIAGVDLVISGEMEAAFCGVRPPGHHAESNRAMGFCLYNNIAVGAAHALAAHGLHRVAIIDFDVHHGNGTQNLVEGDARIFFASTHQMPLYPGTGFPAERGAHGNVLNVPLEPESGSAAMRAAYDRVVFQAVEAFQPELILVSAGFDAHRDDLLANLNWRTEDFAWVTGRICDLAEALCGGRVVSTLEGGYDLTALGQSVAAHVKVLMERGG